jgi:hypothetical protein
LTEPIYADRFYAKREDLVRAEIGSRLDTLRHDLDQLDSPCNVRLMNVHLEKGLTLEEALSLSANERQKILSALLYNDAYWRMEAAYLMLCIGMFSTAYSNLRSCLESVTFAHLIENLDSEAQRFLITGDVNLTKLTQFIPPDWNKEIIETKIALGKFGVHTSLPSMQLTTVFGPSTFHRMVCKTKMPNTQTLPDGFRDASEACIAAIGRVFFVFMWLLSKGTTYNVSDKNR